MWGCEIAFFPNRIKTSLYMFSLFLTFGLGLFSYFRSQRMVTSLQSNLNEYWGTFSSTTRSNIQDFVNETFKNASSYFNFQGFCCGLHGPIDYPALPCPSGTRTGCYEAINNLQSSVSTFANAFLGGSTFLHMFLAISAFILGKPKKKENETDVEAVKIDKAEVMSQHSQI